MKRRRFGFGDDVGLVTVPAGTPGAVFAGTDVTGNPIYQVDSTLLAGSSLNPVPSSPLDALNALPYGSTGLISSTPGAAPSSPLAGGVSPVWIIGGLLLIGWLALGGRR